MTPQRLFLRKIIYLVAMAVLLMVLAWLGQPATVPVGEEKGSGGGVLAQMRRDYNFSEAQLGDIDPASETIKLATLGLRGVAVQVLWEKSNTFKMKKDWANLAATLEQIIRLEPHFSKVWYFQGWNLSYNVSVEFDDYRERYRWVIKGIEFLKNGIRYNRNDPILYRDVAWFIAQKIGRADESVQFRKLFKADEDFHREDEFGPARPLEQRDNWLVGKDWYVRAENVVHQIDPVDPTKGLKKVSPVIFFSNPPMCQMNYSDNLAKDGIFGEKARLAWIEAGDDWVQFGLLPLPGSEPDVYVHLNDKEKLLAEHKALLDELEKMQPGLRESMRQERLRSLTPAERKSYETPPEKRTPKDWELYTSAEKKVRLTHEDVAYRIGQKDRAKGAKALQIARKAMETERKLAEIESQRTIVNFEYWQQHAKVEQTAEARAARKAIYLAEQARGAQDLAMAAKMYAEAFAQWRLVFDKPEWPDLKRRDTVGRELIEYIRDYRKLLENEGQQFPKDFILQDVWDLHEKNFPAND
jgi:hypothetical protein